MGEDLPRHRGRGLAAAAPVLDEHGEGDPRVVGGREGQEPAVREHLERVRRLREPRLRHHLRRARLAAHLDRLESRARQPVPSATTARIPSLTAAIVSGRIPSGTGASAPPGRGLGQVGVDEAAAVRDHRGHPGHLQRCRVHLPLADGDRDRLARVPGRLEDAHLPLRARHEARALVGQVDAGRGAEAHELRPLREAADLEADPDLEEVDVARVRDRAAQVHDPVAARAVEDRVVDGEVARAVEGRRRRDDALLERGRRGDDLERAARRVRALDDAVHERGPGVRGQARPERRRRSRS